jgi:hypothetical protein
MKNIPFVIVACIVWIVLGAAPVVFSSLPLPTALFFSAHPIWQFVGKGLLLVLLFVLVDVVWSQDPESLRSKLVRYFGFALLAGLLTDQHYRAVDVFHLDWQFRQYFDVIGHISPPPDQYRFLPQGTLWWMTLTNGDLLFSYLTYRFFFTFLLCHAIYCFARCYLSPQSSVLIVFWYAAFYPLSTRYYSGNLLDPMSHLVMIMAFYFCWQRRFWSFFWLFVLGVFIKETMLVLAPCYYLMNLEHAGLREERNWQRILLLSVAGMAVFLACRLPFHFNYDFRTLNRTSGSIIYANLGIGQGRVLTVGSLLFRSLHPAPLIIWQRRRLPVSFFWTSLYFAAALYFTNLCFGWNYESRNFIPGLILLLICTMIILVEWMSERPVPGRALNC